MSGPGEWARAKLGPWGVGRTEAVDRAWPSRPVVDKPSAGSGAILWLVRIAVVFGVVCRVSQYAARTSLWHDEALVVLNVLHKSFAGLLGPLDAHEAAPPGFLASEKLLVYWLGRSEYSLRLLPLLGGIVGVISFAGLARRVCGGGAASLWAVLLMGASAKLVVQSNEVKHFTLDLLVAVFLGWLAIRAWYLRRPGSILLAWGALGAIGLWFSFATVFVFAGTSLALAVPFIRAWRWPHRTAYLVANLAVLTALGLLLGPIRAQLTRPLLSFWANSFPDTSSPFALVYWLGRSHLGLFNYFWQPLGGVLLALALLGGVCCWRAGRCPELVCLWLPVLMALAASFVHRWPFGGNQHMVFAAPAVLLLVGEGIEALRCRLARRKAWAGWASVILLLLPGTADAAYRIVSPRLRHEVRPVLESVQRYREPGDTLLVFCPAEVEFYMGHNFPPTPPEVPSSSRVWLIATGSRRKGFPAPAQEMLDCLSVHRPLLRAIEEYGAAAYLFGPAGAPRDRAFR